jgi:hypothetical protein
LVPRRLLIAQFGAIPSAITPEEFNAVSWWSKRDASRLERALDDVLPRGRSYSTEVPLWGTYDGHRLTLVRDETGPYAELHGRVDVRHPDPRFLAALVCLATLLNAVFVGEELEVIAPTMARLADAIGRSRAADYLSNPRALFERLAGEDRSGGCGGAT